MFSVEEFKRNNPHLIFFRASHRVDPDASAGFWGNYENLKDSFVPDRDTPNFPERSEVSGKTTLWGLMETSYPKCLKVFSAMELGIWAIGKCMEQGWEINRGNIYACCANLEMDF